MKKKQLAEYYRINPDGISHKKLEEIAKGVQYQSVFSGEESECLVNSLHLMLSMSRFLMNILTRLNARLSQWNIEADIKPETTTHEIKLRQDLLQILGINMKFELEGNAARAIFREENHEKSISLVTADDPLVDTIKPKKLTGLERNNGDGENTVDDGEAMTRKQIFERILKDLRFLIMVVSSKFPKEEFNIEEFKTAEKNLKIFMLMYCPWVKWPPYFHLLSHCAELLEKYESIGRGSTESKERKNKTMMEYFNFYAKKNK